MKSFLFTIIILLAIMPTSTAQYVVEDNDNNRIENGDYYFIVHGSDGSTSYPGRETLQRKDILEMFIRDSITFHIRNKNEHERHSHICQNRYHNVGLVSTENKAQIPFEFDRLIHTNDPLFFIAMKKDNYGLIDASAKIILPFKYQYCNRVYDMLAVKKKNADSTLIFYSVQGKYLFSAPGYFAEEKKHNYISLHDKEGAQMTVIDRKGKPVQVAGKTYIAWIMDDYICCYKDQRYGIITLTGKRIIPFEYKNLSPTENGQFIVYKNGMAGIIDAENHFILPLDSVGMHNFGLVYIIQKYQSPDMGMINVKGEQILPAGYHINAPKINYDAGPLKKMSTRVMLTVENKNTRLKGIYRSDGIRLLPVDNINLNYQEDKKAIIFTKISEAGSTQLLYGAIDLDGKLLAPASFDKLSFIENSPNIILVIDSNHKSALINIKTGERFSYDRFQYNNFEIRLKDGYIAARSDFKYALVSPDGIKLTEAIYGSLFTDKEKEKKLFDEEVVCLSITREGLVGITKTGKEIPAKTN